jgi:NodT family efflux transporter outer membrane factor (OMF) lipoprotein
VTLLRILAIVGSSLVFAACAVGPDYRRPSAPAPVAFKETWQPAAPSDQLPRGPWWHAYGDPTLDELESAAERSNQTIAAADAQYRSALAAVGGARSALFPTLAVAADTTRSSSAAGSLSGGSLAGAPSSSTYTTDRLTGSVSWEIDLWGRLRRELEVSRSAAEASAGDLAAAQLSVAATLAQDYVQLRALDAQRDLSERTIAAYSRSLEITRNRYAAGVAPRTDVTLAESQLAGAQAQEADLAVQRAALEHAIATLTGRPATEFTLPAAAPLPTLPTLPPVPAVLPATLLERRPDVAAAERRVAAANAAIGVARGAWFPTLSLSGTGGYQASAWGNLVSLPNRFWSLGPTLAATLFDAGARSAQSAVARANYDQAVATYRQTVLTALADAEDSLAALHGLEEEESAQNRAAVAARETLRATENQYRAGTVSYLNIVVAQSISFSADQSLIGVQSRRLLAHVGLLKAMGGAPNP